MPNCVLQAFPTVVFVSHITGRSHMTNWPSPHIVVLVHAKTHATTTSTRIRQQHVEQLRSKDDKEARALQTGAVEQGEVNHAMAAMLSSTA